MRNINDNQQTTNRTLTQRGKDEEHTSIIIVQNQKPKNIWHKVHSTLISLNNKESNRKTRSCLVNASIRKGIKPSNMNFFIAHKHYFCHSKAPESKIISSCEIQSIFFFCWSLVGAQVGLTQHDPTK